MKKRKIVLSILIICILVLGSSFMTKAASSETVSIYHVHGNYCGTTTTYVTQDSDYGGGGSGLRPVSNGTCNLCNGYLEYYAFDSTCSCGKSWSTTGHACINSPEGSYAGSCTNYSKINCGTSHSHPVESYTCGLEEGVAIATLKITSSTDAYAREVKLSGTVTSVSNIRNLKYSWSTGGAASSITVTSNGTYTLTVTGTNIKPASASLTINNVDVTPPTITSLTANVTAPTNGNVILTVNGNDANGLADMAYSWDGSTWSATNTKTVSANGTYTAYVKDIAGNTAKKSITVNNIDKTAPGIQLAADIIAPTNGSVKLTVSGSDTSGLASKAYSWDGTTWNTANTKTVTANGTYTAYVKDAAGNTAKKSITVSNIDKTAPSIQLAADITAPTNGSVKLTVSGSDTSGLASKAYSWDGTTWSTANTKTVTANGTYTAYLKDAAGNTAKKSITVSNIDKTAPGIRLTADVTVLTNGNVKLTVSGSDTSGLASKAYSWDGTTWSTANTKTVTANGTYTAYLKDAAGNTAKKSITVSNIDKTAPGIRLTADVTVPTNGNVKLTVSGSDTSGLAAEAYSWDGITWSTTNTQMIDANGTYIAYVKDAVGNVAEKSIFVSNIDKEAPSIEVTADVTIPTSGDVTLTIASSDTSGLAAEAYSWNGTTWSATNTQEISANGTYTAYVKDAVGNVAEKSITIGNIDKEAPSIEVTADVTAPTSGNVALAIAGSDTSGLAAEAYSWDGTTWNTANTKTVTANGTYTAYIKDVAGNIAKKSIAVSNIDKTAPDIQLTTDVMVPTNGNVKLTVIGSDINGLATEAYSWDGITWSTTNAQEISANGMYTAYVKDTAGNIAKKSIDISNIDRKLPGITVTADIVKLTSENVKLVIIGTDMSGLAAEAYSWDGTTWSNANTKTVSNNGTYTAYVKDFAGNIAKKSITVSNIDKTAPDIQLTANVTTPTNGNIKIEVTGSDTNGLADKAYSWDGTTWSVANTKTVSTNGIYTAYIKDTVGNIAKKSITVSNIDKTAPNIQLTADMTTPTSGNVTLTIAGSDTSGLASEAYSWDGKTWNANNTKTVNTNGIYTAYVKDAVGNIAKKSIDVTNIFIPEPTDKTPPEIKDLYLNTTNPVEEVIIIVVVEEEDVLISWDGGISWGTEDETKALANGVHTVLVKDEAGNIASKSIEVSNVLVPVKEVEKPSEEPEEVTEEPSEEPENESEETSEEPTVIEVIEIIQEEPEIKGNIELWDVVKVAAPVSGGGFFFFFGFWFLTQNATVYVQEGMIEKCLGKIRIKKSGKGYVARISSSMVRKATSNQYRIVVSKRFLKKNEGMYCSIFVGTKEISSRLEREIHVEG